MIKKGDILENNGLRMYVVSTDKQGIIVSSSPKGIYNPKDGEGWGVPLRHKEIEKGGWIKV